MICFSPNYLIFWSSNVYRHGFEKKDDNFEYKQMNENSEHVYSVFLFFDASISLLSHCCSVTTDILSKTLDGASPSLADSKLCAIFKK